MKLTRLSEKDDFSKAQIEKIQKKKTEYKLIGSFSRTKGLKIWSYNILNQNLFELIIKYSNEAHVISDGKGGLTWHDPETSRVNIDSKNIHFEALNRKSALERIRKFKDKTIEDLFNLKPLAKKTINLI